MRLPNSNWYLTNNKSEITVVTMKQIWIIDIAVARDRRKWQNLGEKTRGK